jgi:hypothetical protein
MSTRYVIEETTKPKAKCMACKEVIQEVGCQSADSGA